MTSVGPTLDVASRRAAGRVLASCAPLVVVGVAAGLWQISDRLLYVGPLDRATFGWSVVVPLWALAPFAAAIAWRQLSSRTRRLAALACGLVVGIPVSILLWQSAAFPACLPARRPQEWILPAIILGGVVGGGFALNNLLASDHVRAGQRWRALAVGAAGQLAVIGLGSVIALGLFYGLCQRP
jgi:hypothetical protein